MNYVRTSDYSGYPQENLLSGGGGRESFAKLSAKLDPPDLLSQELDKSPERRSENYPSLIVSSTPPDRPGNTTQQQQQQHSQNCFLRPHLTLHRLAPL